MCTSSPVGSPRSGGEETATSQEVLPTKIGPLTWAAVRGSGRGSSRPSASWLRSSFSRFSAAWARVVPTEKPTRPWAGRCSSLPVRIDLTVRAETSRRLQEPKPMRRTSRPWEGTSRVPVPPRSFTLLCPRSQRTRSGRSLSGQQSPAGYTPASHDGAGLARQHLSPPQWRPIATSPEAAHYRAASGELRNELPPAETETRLR